MATHQLPDPLTRRHLLEGDLDAAKAESLAQSYLDEGREIEAIEFFSRAGNREALATLQAAAIERGDVFLMKAASRGLDEEPTSDRWQALADSAHAAGRERDAESALRLAAIED